MFDFEDDTPEVPETLRRVYHLGVKEGCPRQNVSVGGEDFPMFTEEVLTTPGSVGTSRYRVTGKYRELSDADLERIKRSVKDRVLRGSRLLSRQSRYFVPASGDVPLSRYLYVDLADGKDLPLKEAVPPVNPEAAAAEAKARVRQAHDSQIRARNRVAKQLGETVE